jgi:phage gpG-like protein
MKFNEAKILREQLSKFRSELPRMTDVMLTVALNHSVENFRKQGFDDSTVEPWQPRKRDRYRTKGGRVVNDTSRAILIGKGSGRLRRSLRKRRTSMLSGSLTSSLPYANIHNEGLTGRAWGKYTFKMAKRQFVGNSRNMNRKIEKALELKINRIFK